MKKLNCFIVDENPYVLDSICTSVLSLGIRVIPLRSCNMIHPLLSTIGADLIVCKPTEISAGMVSLVHSIRDSFPSIYLLAISDNLSTTNQVIFDDVCDPGYTLQTLNQLLNKRYPEQVALRNRIQEPKAFPKSPSSIESFFKSIRTLMPIAEACILKNNIDLLMAVSTSIMDLTHKPFCESVYIHLLKFNELLDVGGIVETVHLELMLVINWELDRLERQLKDVAQHSFVQQLVH